jgi:hypothetical protein
MCDGRSQNCGNNNICPSRCYIVSFCVVSGRPSISMATSSLRAFLRGSASVSQRINKRSLSSHEKFEDPSKFVVGVTKEQLAEDRNLQEFFRSNFSEEKVGPALVADENNDEEFEADPLDETRSALNIRKLHCFKRDPVTEEGTRRCFTLRDEEQFIPGLLYGGDPGQNIFRTRDADTKIFVKTKWDLIQKELVLYHRAFESRVYDLTIYEDEEDDVGTVQRVLPKNMNRHPVVNRIFCLNYLRYHPKRPINIPLRYINEEESNALKRGGFIIPQARYVQCFVEDGVPIPESIDVECTGLKLKQVVRIDRLIFPDGVIPSKKVNPKEFLVGSVFGRRSAIGDDK